MVQIILCRLEGSEVLEHVFQRIQLDNNALILYRSPSDIFECLFYLLNQPCVITVSRLNSRDERSAADL